jgi:predicted RNase H-like HicB family nuclease
MMITVYFEAKAAAHIVAQFDSEETYMACFPALEQLASLKGYTITESVNDEEPDDV